MRVNKAKKQIKNLGLEQAHNGIKRCGLGVMKFEKEAELIKMGVKIVSASRVKHKPTYRVTMYIYRADDTVQIIYNDFGGINVSEKIPVNVAREYVSKFGKNEGYMLMIEVAPNEYDLVSQD